MHATAASKRLCLRLAKCSCLAALALGVSRTPGAAERAIVLEEHIGRQWKRELVTYAVSFESGGCHADSVRLRHGQTRVPCQLADVVHWPGGKHVKAARLSFVADLAPRATNTYTLTYAPQPVRDEQPATDLRLSRSKGSMEINTRLLGAKLLLGQRPYDQPEPAASVPGPIVAMRLGNGEWADGSRMYGSERIKSCSAELIAEGPVYAEESVRYVYEDGNTLDIKLHVAAGDSSILVDTNVKETDKGNGWQMVVSDGTPPLTFRLCAERSGTNPYPGVPRGLRIGTWVDVPLTRGAPGRVTTLSPWHDWWNDATQTEIRLQMPGEARELRVTRRDAGAWVTPGPPGKYAAGNEREQKAIPLIRAPSGEVYLEINNHEGQRKWAFGTHPIPEEERQDYAYLGRHEVTRHGEIGRHLAEVKDWVLDWDVKTEHPHLYLNREQLQAIQRRRPDPQLIADMLRIAGAQAKMRSSHRAGHGVGAFLLTGDKQIAKQVMMVEMLEELLGRLGRLDTWRVNGMICSLYDAVMGGGLVDGEKAKLLQARLAYLGYRSADPATWSMERGYCSGNLNMSVANNLLLGILACTIPDHPKAREWSRAALAMEEEMLATRVGPAGEWPESVAHYAHVSASPMLVFAIAAKNAGLADFINDDRMKRLMLFLAKSYSPPDPRHMEGRRKGEAAVLPGVGRGPAGEDFGIHGAMARAAAQSDPAYSRQLQWVWLRGQPRALTGNHLLGWEWVCMDPGLPAETPDWTLDYFPRTGAIMRHGMGTPDEWYIYTICEHTYTVQSESGTLPLIFAKGQPISSRFACSYPDREELLLNRVLLARQRGDVAYRSKHYSHEAHTRKIIALGDLPRQQYLAGDFTIDEPWGRPLGPPAPQGYGSWRMLPEWPPVAKEGQPGVKWRRQVLFVRDDDPSGVNYLVLRDTVTGGQPTMWHFWCFSDKIGTPEEAADREAFLADAPGRSIVPPRQLPQSDRYTALGQYGVDVEFYIATPTDTPRHTLRFGLEHNYNTLHRYWEHQDLLHLQRPDDGSYFVVIYPRKPEEEVPTFAALGDGKVIEVTGKFGTDLCFLAEERTVGVVEDATFDGTVGSIQDRETGLVLSLGAKGRVQYKRYGMAGDKAVELRVQDKGLTVALPRDHMGTTVTVRAPGRWVLAEPTQHVTLARVPDGFTSAVPTGVSEVRLGPQR